jgi:DNA-binding beta-propeller fold protein YncE
MIKTPHWTSVLHEFLRPGHSELSRVNIPPLDGPMRPNTALEDLSPVPGGEISEPSDVLPAGGDGSLFVASRSRILRIDSHAGPGTATSVVAELDGPVTALAPAGDRAVLAAVGDQGIVRVDRSGQVEPVVASAAAGALRCPTALAVDPAGDTLYVCDGSRDHVPDEWIHDLMEGNATGRLVAIDRRTGSASVLLDGLAWPAGVAVAPDGTVVFSTAWDHSVRRFDPNGTTPVTVLQRGLPGYPGKLAPAGGGGYWLAVFALRTQLVEFVLMEHEYRQEMMRTIEPEYWIRPALRTLDSALEPIQGGAIKKLGVKKPWAPPRSYGMVLRLDADGEILASLQSPADGTRHGVVSAREHDGRLYVASQGGDVILVREAA